MIVPLHKAEKIIVLSAIVESDYKVTAAARSLEIGTRTIYDMLKRWGIPIKVSRIRQELEQLQGEKA